MQDNPNTPIGASIKDICKRHSCSRAYLYGLIGDKKIIARKNGKRTIVDVKSADAYFASLPSANIKSTSKQPPRPAADAELLPPPPAPEAVW